VYGSSTLLARHGSVSKIGAKWGYTAWHPSGTVVVYSLNDVRQFFHAGRPEVRDVVDLDSALVCYLVEEQRAVCPAPLAEKDRLETYPAWSPDGQYLYFCSAPILWKDRNQVPPENYDKVKYDLRRVPYDVQTQQWGPAETVLFAEQTGLSILLPRISPDGRFLLFCMCAYGCFPAFQPSSDLYLMDLATRKYQRLAINSEDSESWHSWSSSSRWIAFSSKRQGGLFTRTYLSYVDADGQAHKAFVLPQQDPGYYDSLMETYSVPELVRGPVQAGRTSLARAARANAAITVEIPLTMATPKATKTAPYQERE
jgi:Tol biopolymer transport system component